MRCMPSCRSGEICQPMSTWKQQKPESATKSDKSNKDKEEPNRTTEKHTKSTTRGAKPENGKTKSQKNQEEPRQNRATQKKAGETNNKRANKNRKKAPSKTTLGHTRAKREERRHAPRQKITKAIPGETSTTHRSQMQTDKRDPGQTHKASTP